MSDKKWKGTDLRIASAEISTTRWASISWTIVKSAEWLDYWLGDDSEDL